MIVRKSILVGMLLVFTLSACQKQEELPAQDSTNTQGTGVTNPTQAQLDAINGSPTISIWTAGMKLGATLMLMEEYPKMDEKVQECLLGAEADKAYFEHSKTEMLSVLGEDGIKIADEFYNSEVGKRVAQYSQEQALIAGGKKIDKPLTLSEEDLKKMDEFKKSEIMKKMAQNIATISPEKMEADLAVIAKQEAIRCGLGEQDTNKEKS